MVNAGPPPPKRDNAGFGGERPRFDSSSSGFRGGSRGSFDAANRLYVGNLSWGVDNAALENLFSEQAKVVEPRVVYDMDTGRSRGFRFVTYSSAEEANSAVESLDGVVSRLIMHHSGGQSVVLDAKPWDDVIDMKKLEEVVRSVFKLKCYCVSSKMWHTKTKMCKQVNFCCTKLYIPAYWKVLV